MARFGDIKTLWRFASAHASVHNHSNHDRHLNKGAILKKNRSAVLAGWRELAASGIPVPGLLETGTH